MTFYKHYNPIIDLSTHTHRTLTKLVVNHSTFYKKKLLRGVSRNCE